MGYKLTRQDLTRDLYIAFYDARRHKANMSYVARFERDLHRNIEHLCDSLITRSYQPKPSKCFIIEYPKKREVFAAQFIDRVVHHLYFNYTHELFERTFIQDTYSCIKERGTHYGINRLASHIRQESCNYQHPCYILKLDIRGYFMHIKRERLQEIASNSLRAMQTHRISKGRPETWEEVIDIDFLLWLTKEIILLDPKTNCELVGSKDNWNGLDRNKSLFFTEEGCGLPIGNLTSQLFSNVYLNVFDQYMKRELHCRHYGRYVDDAYIVSCDKEWMLSLVPEIRMFLKESLCLELHMGKLSVCQSNSGVEFLGSFVKPYRNYVSNQSLRRVKSNIGKIDFTDHEKVFRTVNSYLGMFVHYSSFNLRKELFLKQKYIDVAKFDSDMTKMDKRTIKRRRL